MIRIRRTTVTILLAIASLAVTGCSSTEAGTAITGSALSSAGASSGVRPLPAVSAPASAGTAVSPASSAPPASAPATGGVPASTPPGAITPTTSAAPSTVPTMPNPPTGPTGPSAPKTTAARTTANSAGTRPVPGSRSTPPPTTAPATSRPPTGASFPVCPGIAATNISGIVGCLKTSVSNFWSGELNEVVDQDVIVDPSTAQVPAGCRGGLTAAPAFTCQVDDTVYINQSFLDEVTKDFGASDIPYALASVVSHEIGHVVQAAVKQPGYDRTGSSNTISQQIEQQADCLSGVWAQSQARLGRLDTKVFQTVAKQLITDVSSNPEVYTHGTPDQRAAAILQGLSTGTPQGCKLNTFS